MLIGTKGPHAGSAADKETGLVRILALWSFVVGSMLLLGGCDGLGGTQDAQQPTLAVFPDEDFLIAGVEGGPFFPETKVYLVSNGGDEPLQWSTRATHPSIGFTPAAGTLDGGESVIVTAFVNVVPGVTPGRYVASMFFVNDSNGAEEIERKAIATVSAANSILEVSPSIGFSSSGPVGGPFTPLSAGYSLSNSGSAAIDWAIESSQTWLSASLATGQLQPGGSQAVTLAIDPVQAAQFAAGSHSASVLFRDLTNVADFEIVVTVEVIEPAMLVVTPSSGFSTSGPPSGPFSPVSQTYVLGNTGSQLLTWQATRNTNWVTLSRTSGNLGPGQQTTVVVGIDANATSALPDGIHTDTLSFTNTTSGLGDTTRPVSLTLVSPPAMLTVTPGQPFSSAGPEGGPFQPASKTYTLANTGGVPLNWQATSTVAWVALTPASGSLAPSASVSVVASINQAVAGSLGAGQYSGQLTFTNLTSGAGSSSVGATLNVSGGGSAPVLTPGSGFPGPTQEPGRIGTGTAKSIARWDVVPYQTIVEQTTPIFTVGVVAFHIAGIARVSFSLEGGPFFDSTSMMLNPQTGVWEYCATIDTSTIASDGRIELRAIAYPNAAPPQPEGTNAYPGGGFPRLLESLFLYVDSGSPATPIARYCSPSGSDSTGDGSQGNPFASPWKAAQAVATAGGGSADGGIVYMNAGSYTWGPPGVGPVPATNDQWLTFQPWPGVRRDQVRIVDSYWPGMMINRVRLHEVTLNWFVHGADGGGGSTDSIWLDHVTCRGSGNGNLIHFAGWTPGFQHKYWTNVDVSDDSQSMTRGIDLARNCTAARNSTGPDQAKLVINCTWDTLSNGGNPESHPDFIVWNFNGPEAVFDNQIFYGITGRNMNSIGIFLVYTGHLTNTAFVNVAMDLVGVENSHVGGFAVELEHFLMLNVTHRAGFIWACPQSIMKNLSIRGCHFDGMGLELGADSVAPGWFDNNSYGLGGITPGTNVTISDPQWINTFVPGPSSPLRNRLDRLLVPIDKDGSLRTTPATVGAVE